MEEESELVSITLDQDTPVIRTDDGKGHPLLQYEINHMGSPLVNQQYQGRNSRAPETLAKGTQLEILIAPPEGGNWSASTRHAISTAFLRAGICPQCNEHNEELGTLIHDPERWSCMKCVFEEIDEAVRRGRRDTTKP